MSPLRAGIIPSESIVSLNCVNESTSKVHKFSLITKLENSDCKVGCVFLMFVVSMLLHAEIGRNNHREGAPHLLYKSLEALPCDFGLYC